MYINLYLPLFSFAYLFFSFFPFLSTYLLVLFSFLPSPLDILLQFSFSVCALVNFVLNWSIYLFIYLFFALLAESIYFIFVEQF